MYTFIYLVTGIIFSVAFPLGLLIWWNKKHKGSVLPFIVGAICFTLFAMVLEQIPHYFVMNPNSAIGAKITSSALLYTLYGAFAAGIFEETGRLFGFKVLLKKRTEKSTAVAYGIGHGGAEVFLVLGVSYIVYLIASLGISFGSTEADAVMATALTSLTPGTLLLAIWERISAVMIHIGLSMVVFTAAKEKGKIWLYPVAILLHALVDTGTALYQFGVIKSIIAVEVVTFVFALICLFIGIKTLYGKTETEE